MSTYYKYAERKVENQIDWFTVGKDFTNMLNTESDLREKKKADIEKATQETLKSLSDAPTGLDKGANENILNFSAQGQDYLLMMNRLLKSGQLDPKDYSIYTQNLKSSTGKLFSAAKVYQENYAKNIERANAKGLKRASSEELWNRTQAENAANFSKSQYYINQNGNVTVGIPTKDPTTGQYVLNNNPDTYKNPEQLYYASSVDIDPFDVDGAVGGIVNTFGKNIIAEAKLQNRFVVSVEDITERAGYEEAENNFIKGALAGNSSNGASILTDWINSEGGKQYGYTSNPNDPQIKTGEKILMIADPANPTSGRMIPQLNPEQEARAEKFMKERLRMALDREIKVQYQEPQPDQEWKTRRGDEKKEKETAVGTWGKIFKATTPQEKRDAVQTILGTNLARENGLVDIDLKTSGKIKLVYDNPSLNRTIDYDPNNITLQRWNELGNELHGVDDVLSVMKRTGGGNPTMKMSTAQRNFTGVSAGREIPKNAKQLLDSYLGTVSNLTTVDDPTQTVKTLSSNFSNLGYTFEGEKNTFKPDRVKITAPNGKNQWFVLKGNNDTAIKKFIAGNKNDKLILENISAPSEDEGGSVDYGNK